MKRNRIAITDVIYSVMLFGLLAGLPAALDWKPHPLAAAFSMMPSRLPAGSADTIASLPPTEEETSHTSEAKQAGPSSASLHDSAASAPALPESYRLEPIVPASPLPVATPSVSAADAVTVRDAVYKASPSSPIKTAFQPIPVLNYHSVSVDPGNIVVIHPDKFRRQMQYLHDNGYTPLTMKQFIEIIEGTGPSPEKPVLLTFDDGYTDNMEAAMPILKEFGFPAVLFMSPGMVEQDGYINWDQAKTLKDNGWEIYPHGMTHPSLPELSPEDQAREIHEARRLIEEKLGGTADIYCYPYGRYNKDTLKVLGDGGFRYAFTIEQGKTAPGQHPYKLTRIFVNGEEELSVWAKRLKG